MAPELHYVKGSHNVVADALSHLDLEPKMASQCNDNMRLDIPTSHPLAEAFGYDKQDIANTACPVMYKLIMREQQKDKMLMKCAQSSMDIILHSFHGGRKSYQLLCENGKIIIPKNLQKKVSGMVSQSSVSSWRNQNRINNKPASYVEGST